MNTAVATTIIVPTICVTFKTLGVKVGVNKAARKIARDAAVCEVNRAVTRWFYSR